MTTEAGSAHWSDYWANGFLTSLPEDFRRNYDGEVADFWHRQFEAAPAAAAILHLCTGNGAVALLAAEFGRVHGREFRITAVDAAKIDTAAMSERFPEVAEWLPDVRFIGEQRVEDLDFEDASFDLVTSQFGIEYCDWAAAAAQIGRLLRPAGRLALVTHESTSDILVTMEREYREYQLVEQLGFHSMVSGYLHGEVSYANLKSSMRKALDELGAVQRSSPSPFLHSMLMGINGIMVISKSTLRKRLPGLHKFQRQVALGQARLEDMLRVNRAIRDNPRWIETFAVGGICLEESGDLYYRGRHHAGRFYTFVKG